VSAVKKTPSNGRLRFQSLPDSDARLEAALKSARRRGDRELLAVVGCAYVRRLVRTQDCVKARHFLELARQARSRSARLHALHAEALILGCEERVEEQARRLIELLRALVPAETVFAELRASGTAQLAHLARELAIPEAIAEIDRQLSGAAWTADFTPKLFDAHRDVAWAKALAGDYFNAGRHLKRASAVASTAARKVVAACDRASLARSLGEHRWSRVELDEAELLASEVDWETANGEERIGLLMLAELFSRLDAARSAGYLTRYRELSAPRSRARGDLRRESIARQSIGIIEIALGNKGRGIALLREACKIFERLGYDFRAAWCLMSEFEATGNPDLLPIVKERLRNHGQSWLAAQLRASSNGSEIPLPPMQRRVFVEVCQGKSTAAIAKSLGRSEFTVSNHIKAIFKAFDVNSRPALIAEAVRQGLVKTP
jgi:DNA-binding CsgD family transcriptional regulator